jgi:hypothetical protein
MLHDPKRDRTLEGPLALENLIDWLEKQPADATYTWTHPQSCLLANYLGYEAPAAINGTIWGRIVYGDIGSIFTYGEALKRARKVARNRRRRA